nr:response regulator transcription factor [Pelagibacterium limicola]
MRALLKSAFDIRACCGDGDQTLEALATNQPQIAILDIEIPPVGALAVVNAARRLVRPPRFAVVTSDPNNTAVCKAIEAGAFVVLADTLSATDFASRLCKISDGVAALDFGNIKHRIPSVGEKLSEREKEIVHLVCAGNSNKQIASKLNLAHGTIKVHLHNIFVKLSICKRISLTHIDI